MYKYKELPRAELISIQGENIYFEFGSNKDIELPDSTGIHGVISVKGFN